MSRRMMYLLSRALPSRIGVAWILIFASPVLGEPPWDSVGGEWEDALTVRAYWQNDSAPLKPNNDNDGHYTNGFAITAAHQPEWARAFAEDVGLIGPGGEVAVGYVLGQLMFTPDAIARTDLVRGDRPYAGYLFLGVYGQRAWDTDWGEVFDHAQLDIGVVGPSSGADKLQKSIHEWLDTVVPRGWEHQIEDQLTVQFTYRRKWKLWRDDVGVLGRRVEWELIPAAEVSLGSVYRHVEGGAVFRVGGNLPGDFGPGRIADPAAATGHARPGLGFYIFGRVGGRLVAHNLLLEGNNHLPNYEIDPKHAVGEVQYGAVLRYRFDDFALEAGYGQTFMTRQFEKQDRTDAFATLSVGATVGFCGVVGGGSSHREVRHGQALKTPLVHATRHPPPGRGI